MLGSSGKVSPNGSASKAVEHKSTYQVFGASALQSELKTIYKSQIEESVLDVNDTLQKASKEVLLSIIKSVRTALPASNSIIRKSLNGLFTNAVGSGSRGFQSSGIPLKLEPEALEVKLESRIKEEPAVIDTGIQSKYQKTLDELEILESLLTGQTQTLATPFETPLLNSLQRFFEEQIATRNAKVQQLEDKSIQDSKDMMVLRRQGKDKDQQLTKLQADLQESQRLFQDVSRQLEDSKQELVQIQEKLTTVGTPNVLVHSDFSHIKSFMGKSAISIFAKYSELEKLVDQKISSTTARYESATKTLMDKLSICSAQLKIKTKRAKTDKDKLADLQRRIATLETEKIQLSTATANKDADASVITTEYELRLKTLSQEHSEAVQNLISKHQEDVKALQHGIEQSKSTVSELQRQVSEVHAQLAASESTKNHLQSQLDLTRTALQEESARLNSTNSKHQQDLVELQDKYNQYSQELQTALNRNQSQVSGLGARVSELEQALANSHRETEAVKHQQAQTAKDLLLERESCSRLKLELEQAKTLQAAPTLLSASVALEAPSVTPPLDTAAQLIEEQKRILKEKREKKKAAASQEGPQALPAIIISQPAMIPEEHIPHTRSVTLLENVATGAAGIISDVLASNDGLGIDLDDMLAAQVPVPIASPRDSRKVQAKPAWEAPLALFAADPEPEDESQAAPSLGKRKPRSEQKSKPKASEASAKDPAEDKDQQANTQVLLQQLNSANTTIDDLRVRLSESEKRLGNLAQEKADLEKQVLLKRSLSPPKGGNASKKNKGASDVSMMVAEITIDSKSGTELAFLKSQLELKTQLLVKCKGALIDLKSQTRVLVAELESTRGILKQFTRQISFAINKRFTSTFTKLLTIGVQKSNLRSASKERAVTERDGGATQTQKTGRQLRPQRSLELNASYQGNQSYDESVWNEPEFIRERTFETLLAYVERKEREEGKPGFYSNNLILHNVNRDWDKPYGVLISNSAQATPLTGSNEKVPPGPEIMAHTARKLASEKSVSGRSGSRSPNKLKKERLPEISEKKSSKSGQKPREKPKVSVLEDEPSTPFPKKGYSPKRTGSKTNGNHPDTAAGQSTARFGGEKPVTFGKERRVSTEKPAVPREPASEEFTLQGKKHKKDSITPRDGSRKDRTNTRREFRNLQKELEQAREPDTPSAKKIKKEVVANVKRESNTTQQQEPPLKAVVGRLRSSIDQDRKTLGFERDHVRGRTRSKSPTTKLQTMTPEKGARRTKQEPSPSEDRSVTKRLRSREHSHGRNSQSNR